MIFYKNEKPNTTTMICYGTTIISIICITLCALIIPFLQMRLNSANLSIEKRMEIFKESTRSLWQDVITLKTDRKQNRYKRQGNITELKICIYLGYGSSSSDESQQQCLF